MSTTVILDIELGQNLLEVLLKQKLLSTTLRFLTQEAWGEAGLMLHKDHTVRALAWYTLTVTCFFPT